jgi:FkbM family methyltransferase
MRKILRTARKMARTVMGKDLMPRIDMKCPKGRFGTGDCGWDVALGTISRDSVIYSFGIGHDISFETELIDRFGMTVHAFDPTPRSLNWIRENIPSDNFVLHEYGLAGFDGEVFFEAPENPEHVSYRMDENVLLNENSIILPVRKLGSIIDDLCHKKIDVLKMDIEGAEYKVIDSLNEARVKPHQLLVEFHHRFPGIGVHMTKNAINTLRKIGYSLFSVSESCEEFCFIRN